MPYRRVTAVGDTPDWKLPAAIALLLLKRPSTVRLAAGDQLDAGTATPLR
jgi:hypothetical protein